MKGMWVTAALALVVAGPGPARERPGGDKPAPLPGDALWDYGAWADDYLVTATAYDPATNKVTWTLEARKKVTARRYQARFTDPDLLEMAAREIELTPALKEYPKGTRVKAVMKMPTSDIMREVNRVTIGSPP